MAGQDDPYPLYNRMEDFQRACLGAVAAAAGVTTAQGGPDFDKTDSYLTVLEKDRSLTLQAQLKSTHALEEKDGHVLFDLDAPTFNRLRDADSSTSPRVLVVMEVPEKPEHWAACDHDKLMLKRRVFWTHLYGEEATENTASKRIKIATDRLLTAETFVPAMKQVTADFYIAKGVNGGA
jgi:hypothetical protein